jgi:hypothetical protein
MFSASGALGGLELPLRVNLALEAVQKGGARIRRELAAVALRVQCVRGEPGPGVCVRPRSSRGLDPSGEVALEGFDILKRPSSDVADVVARARAAAGAEPVPQRGVADLPAVE